MTRDSSIALVRDRLLYDIDFDIFGTDRTTGVCYRVTVHRGEIDVAPFSRFDPAFLSQPSGRVCHFLSGQPPTELIPRSARRSFAPSANDTVPKND